MTTLDPIAAAENREAAIALVTQGADPALLSRWIDVLHDVARSLPLFTTDDVRLRGADLGVPGFEEPRAFGAVLRAGKANGWITPSPLVRTSQRPQSHGANLRVWISTISDERVEVAVCRYCDGTGHDVQTVSDEVEFENLVLFVLADEESQS